MNSELQKNEHHGRGSSWIVMKYIKTKRENFISNINGNFSRRSKGQGYVWELSGNQVFLGDFHEKFIENE